MTYLLDCTVLNDYLKYSRHLRSGTTEKVEQLRTSFERTDALGVMTFSSLTVWEVERWLTQTGATAQLSAFRRVAAMSNVLPVSDGILREATKLWARVRAAGLTPGDVDTLLLATAVYYGHTVVSSDRKLAPVAEAAGVRLVDWRAGDDS